MTRPVVSLGRKQAAKLIEEIAAACAKPSTDSLTVAFIRGKLRQNRIEFELCSSPVHQNEDQVDNCLTCAPHWGVVGPEVKVR